MKNKVRKKIKIVNVQDDSITDKVSNIMIKINGIPFLLVGEADIQGHPNNFQLAGLVNKNELKW